MTKLLEHLKKFKDGRLKIIYIELEKFENDLHVDNRGTLGINDKNYLQSIPLEKTSLIKKHYRRTINNGLCIIINQIYFKKEVLMIFIQRWKYILYSILYRYKILSSQYETRYGTEADCITLSETFKVFGFKVEVLENLEKNKMLKKIKNISKDYGKKYDCLFLCILSHGYKGK